MGAPPRDADRAHFRYEPSHPPSIPPGMTVAAYRRARSIHGRSRATREPTRRRA